MFDHPLACVILFFYFGLYWAIVPIEQRFSDCLVTPLASGCRKELTESEGSHGIFLEGDIGGGLAMVRHIDIPNESPKVLQIRSSIEARSVGAGSGGFSRLV